MAISCKHNDVARLRAAITFILGVGIIRVAQEFLHISSHIPCTGDDMGFTSYCISVRLVSYELRSCFTLQILSEGT